MFQASSRSNRSASTSWARGAEAVFKRSRPKAEDGACFKHAPCHAMAKVLASHQSSANSLPDLAQAFLGISGIRTSTLSGGHRRISTAMRVTSRTNSRFWSVVRPGCISNLRMGIGFSGFALGDMPAWRQCSSTQSWHPWRRSFAWLNAAAFQGPPRKAAYPQPWLPNRSAQSRNGWVHAYCTARLAGTS